MNDNYLLDLFGLGNGQITPKIIADNPHFVYSELSNKNVHLIMIYDNWFNKIPANWCKSATLEITSHTAFIGKKVTFYFRPGTKNDNYLKSLRSFSSSLPKDVKLTFVQ